MSDDLFKKTLEAIKTNKENRDQGRFNNIPFGLPSLDAHVPGVMKGLQYIVTASSGVGKTQLTKFLFVNQPYKFMKEHPQMNIKLKILYFALEESKEEFMLSLICNRLKDKYNIDVSTMQLKSIGVSLPNEVLRKVEECSEYFSELEQCLEIVDTVSNPFGIYKYVRSYATKNGKHHYTKKVFTSTEEDGSVSESEAVVYDRYEANDPNEIVIVITDHVSLLSTEKDPDCSTLHGAMTKFSAEYCRKMISKHYKYCVVNVQQQAAEKEKQQFTNSGQSIEAKLEPSLDGLANNKETQRD